MTRPNFTLRIDPSDLTRLQALQKATGATVAEHVRRAIGAYLAAGPATRQLAGLFHGNASFVDEAALLHKRRSSKKGRE